MYNGQLPPGWDIQLDNGTGKHYFIDHNNKITTWIDPRTNNLYDGDINSSEFSKKILPEDAINIPIHRMENTTPYNIPKGFCVPKGPSVINQPRQHNIGQNYSPLMAQRLSGEEIASQPSAFSALNIGHHVEKQHDQLRGRPTERNIPIQTEKNFSNLEVPSPDQLRSDRSRSASPFVVNSLGAIERILSDVSQIETKIQAFTGMPKDKDYLILEDTLEKKIIRLDGVESEGEGEVRLARKNAVRTLQDLLNKLEATAKQNKAKTVTNGNDVNKATGNKLAADPSSPAAQHILTTDHVTEKFGNDIPC